MNKKCTNCGAQLAAQAAFCPHCATPQREKVSVMPPRRWRRTALKGTVALCLLAALCLFFAGWERWPQRAGQEDGVLQLPAASNTLSATPTPPATPSPSAVSSPVPSAIPTPSENPTPSATPAVSAAPTPTPSETPAPTPAPSPSPAQVPAPTPAPVEKGVQAVWKNGGREYRLALSFYGDKPSEWKSPVETIAIECHPRFNMQTDSTLYVWDTQTGEDASDEFKELVAGITVTGSAISGGGVTAAGQPEFKDSIWTCTIRYNAQSGTGEVTWTLNMKNGDVIELAHRMIVSPYPTMTISSANARLDTSADLQAALDAIGAEDRDKKYILLELPGVTYEEPVVLPVGRYEINCADQRNPPNFAGGLTIAGGEATCTGLLFEGSGGTGITADGHIMMYECTVRGWDTGVIANDGAWAAIHTSTFEGNGIGLHFDSSWSNFLNPQYDGNVFRNNRTAILLERVPYSPPFTFPDTHFSFNETDMDNLCGKKLDFSCTRFER